MDVLVKFDTFKVSKSAKIKDRYNQVPNLTQDTNGKVQNSQLDTTNETQEVSPFPVGDHKVQINRRAQRHNKHISHDSLLYNRGYRLQVPSVFTVCENIRFAVFSLQRVKPTE